MASDLWVIKYHCCIALPKFVYNQRNINYLKHDHSLWFVQFLINELVSPRLQRRVVIKPHRVVRIILLYAFQGWLDACEEHVLLLAGEAAKSRHVSLVAIHQIKSERNDILMEASSSRKSATSRGLRPMLLFENYFFAMEAANQTWPTFRTVNYGVLN